MKSTRGSDNFIDQQVVWVDNYDDSTICSV